VFCSRLSDLGFGVKVQGSGFRLEDSGFEFGVLELDQGIKIQF
jgi:hypothetical protein